MSILILLSTTGIVIDWHYCNDVLKDWALFSNAESCHQEKVDQPHCPFHAAMQASEEEGTDKNCCENETEFFQLDIDLVSASVQTTPKDVENSFAIGAFLNQLNAKESRTIPTEYLNYKPPLIKQDLSIWFCTFLC